MKLVESTFKCIDQQRKNYITLDDISIFFKREATMYTGIEIQEIWKALGKHPKDRLTKAEYSVLMAYT